MDGVEQVRGLGQAALGKIAVDRVITRGTAFNVFTREFIPNQAIWINDGLIRYVGPDHDPACDKNTQKIDADGMVLVPGLLDGHTHIISRCGIEQFVKHVLPTGVTTVITETIELATIVGKAGLDYLAKGVKGQPIRTYYTLAPLCGLTAHEEINNAPGAEDYPSMLNDSACLGLGGP